MLRGQWGGPGSICKALVPSPGPTLEPLRSLKMLMPDATPEVLMSQVRQQPGPPQRTLVSSRGWRPRGGELHVHVLKEALRSWGDRS